MSESRKLNRYIQLPILLDILSRRKLVLLGPNRWPDRNDAELIEHYRLQSQFDTILAICMSHGDETLHTWKAYASGVGGCCIQFDRDLFLESFPASSGFRHGEVTYKKLNDKSEFSLDDLPFIKRWPYRCEEEYRIIWSGHGHKESLDVEINPKSIQRITVSQDMPASVFSNIKNHLQKFDGIRGVGVYRSTLYENKKWLKKFRK